MERSTLGWTIEPGAARLDISDEQDSMGLKIRFTSRVMALSMEALQILKVQFVRFALDPLHVAAPPPILRKASQ